MRWLKAFLLAELLGSLACIGIVVFGSAFFMFICQFVGFLPYSDRLGPGFYRWFPLRSFSDIGGAAWFYLSFALFTAPFFAMYAVPALTIFSCCGKPPSTVGSLSSPPRWYLAS
jgi:hypothetical protein